MNRLVRDHYPVSNLPDDLREGFEGRTDVRVTIDVPAAQALVGIDDAQNIGKTPPASIQNLFAMRRPPFLTNEQIEEHLQALRSEWD